MPLRLSPSAGGQSKGSELVRVPKHRAVAGALIRAGHSAHTIGPLKNDLVEFIAAADRASERKVEADHSLVVARDS